MPYTLSKEEKAAIRRQYQENIRILNTYLPEGQKIRPNLKALNKRLNDPKEQRFYKKSLEFNRRRDFKLAEASRLKRLYEPQLRDKSKADPLERLMHCELASSNTPEAKQYNELKVKNYYLHPEAETQRRFQKVLDLDISPLAKAVKTNDLDNYLLDYYEKNEAAVEDGYCFVQSTGKFNKDDLSPDMKKYLDAVGRNQEMLVSINNKVVSVEEGYYFSFPELTIDQEASLTENMDFQVNENVAPLFESFKKRTLGRDYSTKTEAEFKDFFTKSEQLGINLNEKGVMSKLVAENKSTGEIYSYTDITRNKFKGNNIPEVKRLNEQEIAGVHQILKKDYTKEKGFLDLDLPREFQKPGVVQAREELIFNYALEKGKSLTEVDNKGLGEIAESIKGGLKEQIFHTTSREYKNFITAMKNFEKPNKIGEYQNSDRVVGSANQYLIHRGVTSMEQALAQPEPQRSRCVLCLNTINTFQKHADPTAEKVVPGTNQIYQEQTKKSDWPAAILDKNLVNDEPVIDNNIEKDSNVIENVKENDSPKLE